MAAWRWSAAWACLCKSTSQARTPLRLLLHVRHESVCMCVCVCNCSCLSSCFYMLCENRHPIPFNSLYSLFFPTHITKHRTVLRCHQSLLLRVCRCMGRQTLCLATTTRQKERNRSRTNFTYIHTHKKESRKQK